MHSFRTQLLASTAILVLSSAAYAADMPVKAPPPMAPAAPVINWTGFYVGAQIGGASFDPSCSTTSSRIDRGFACSSDTEGATSTGSLSTGSVIGGGKIGYDYQWGRVVLGVVGEFDWTHLDGTTHSSFESELFSDANERIEWLASARGRLGWAFDNMLFYATGGVAWTQIKGSVTFNEFGENLLASSPEASTDRTGVVAGGGFEYRFTPNISFVGELLWYDFGTTSINSFCPLCGGATYTTTFKSQDIVSGTLGVNWRF